LCSLMMVREWVLWQYWDCFPTVKCRVEAFETGGLIDCEKSVCESRESQRECDTLSQLQTPRQLVVLAQPP